MKNCKAKKKEKTAWLRLERNEAKWTEEINSGKTEKWIGGKKLKEKFDIKDRGLSSYTLICSKSYNFYDLGFFGLHMEFLFNGVHNWEGNKTFLFFN